MEITRYILLNNLHHLSWINNFHDVVEQHAPVPQPHPKLWFKSVVFPALFSSCFEKNNLKNIPLSARTSKIIVTSSIFNSVITNRLKLLFCVYKTTEYKTMFT